MATYNKMTILPLHYCDRRLNLPIGIGVDLTVESIEGLLRPDNFELWRDYVTKKEREDLASTRVGIVHRFSSEDHVGRLEVDSQDKVFKAFVFLRLIRPTRERYSNIQLSVKDGQPDVFSFAHAAPLSPNAPNLQVFNTFHQGHLERLVRLLPKFLHFASSGLLYRTRAVRFFEAGYSQVADPLLQFVTWMIGIESLLSEDAAPVAQGDLVRRIEELIGAETNIYSEAETELFPREPAPLLIKELLPDIFTLRNRAVHGVRGPSSFDERTTSSPATNEAVHYVDVLREGASFVLRNLVLKAIADTNV
ncbi:MAG TPA: hypothetical protein VN310_19380 [Candidatus Dormibacteraeota bacterium]|jgi:hypothetical protein|nr:hypothetical protein [Candidatus Dormibacteraeota bacterium]